MIREITVQKLTRQIVHICDR